MATNHTLAHAEQLPYQRRLRRVEQHLLPDCRPPSQLTFNPTSTHKPTFLSDLHRHIVLSSTVKAALLAHSPVLALESTIISHGMKYPENYNTALRVQQAVSSLAVTPATIAVLAGRIHVGLTDEQIQQLAQRGTACRKCSRRELPLVIAEGGWGSTTVAATMFIAHAVGIRVFATGGIGGVHRGGESTMDISADLDELAHTSVTVVCAGVKSILDIPRTLEVLETRSVPVITLSTNASHPFPAFFSPLSNCPSPCVLPSTAAIAELVQRMSELAMEGGVLVAVPNPNPAEGEKVEAAINTALREAAEKGVKGAATTPYLLLRIAELTGGESLESNIALILNNVRVGAQLAIDLNRLQATAAGTLPASLTAAPFQSSTSSPPQLTSDSANGHTPTALSSHSPPSPPSNPTVIVCGGLNKDLIGRPDPNVAFLLGTSNPGFLEHHLGGVGRNVAECLARLDHQPVLLTAVGDDQEGEICVEECRRLGMRVDGSVVRMKSLKTSTYLAVMNEQGDLFTTIADMRCVDALTPSLLPPLPFVSSLRVAIIDGNLPTATITQLATTFSSHRVPVLFECTSIEKSARGMEAWRSGLVTILTPSAAELLAMAETCGYTKSTQGRDAYQHNNDEEALKQQTACLLHSLAALPPSQYVHIVVKRGAQGVLLCSQPLSVAVDPAVQYRRLRGRKLDSVVSTSGAGDTLVGAMVSRLLERGQRVGDDIEAMVEAIEDGMAAAELTLMTHVSLSPLITRDKMRQLRQQRYG